MKTDGQTQSPHYAFILYILYVVFRVVLMLL